MDAGTVLHYLADDGDTRGAQQLAELREVVLPVRRPRTQSARWRARPVGFEPSAY